MTELEKCYLFIKLINLFGIKYEKAFYVLIDRAYSKGGVKNEILENNG